MRSLTTTSRPEDFVGSYGPDYRTGILAEHADLFVAAGGFLRAATSGSSLAWATVDLYGPKAIPLVCGDFVAWMDEDGRTEGRCGHLATDDGACSAHAAEREAWLATTEAERLAWERAHDAEVYV